MLIIWIAGMVYWQYLIINFLFQEANFSPQHFYLDHFDFRLFMFCSHSQNQDEITVSFILRRKFIFLFLEEAVRMLMGILFIICIAVWQYFIIIFFSGSKFFLPSMWVVFGIRFYSISVGHFDCSHGALTVF